jgi:hypothetical protein
MQSLCIIGKTECALLQAMDAIRASADAAEARKHASTLQRLTAATRASMEQHVRAEEQEVWTLQTVPWKGHAA